MAVAGAMALLYLLYNLGDLALIKSGTPQGYWLSYGVDVLWLRTREANAPVASLVRWLSWGGACAAIGVSVLRRRSLPSAEEGRGMDGFRAGVACYAGTFVALGTSFNYRLMFLLFAMPQLLEWAGNPASARSAWPASDWAESTCPCGRPGLSDCCPPRRGHPGSAS
ncbi:MAG: hypothetical protein WDM96_04880 [Lacunisphaera sp.]